jgi:putative acetyltransferase
MMLVRVAEEKDLPEIAVLFSDTINHVSAKDYSAEQLKLWSTRDDIFWRRRFVEQHFIVAISGDAIVGFSSLTKSGYIDFMYVHKDYQRKGIAKMLLQEIEHYGINIGLTELHADVSITAKSFFLKQGFMLIKQNHKKKGNTSLINYSMYKVCKS